MGLLFWTFLCSAAFVFAENNESGIGDSDAFALDTTDTGAEGNAGFADSQVFVLNTTDTGAEGDSGYADSNGVRTQHHRYGCRGRFRIR